MSSHEKPPTFKSLIRLSAIGPALLGVPILMIICAMFFREAGDYADKALAILLYTPWVGFPLFWYLLTARSRWGLRYSRQQEAALFFGATVFALDQKSTTRVARNVNVREFLDLFTERLSAPPRGR